MSEARILASLVDDPAGVDDAQFERWAADFASWDLCDQVCQNLFRHCAQAWDKAREWTGREEPFVKRAGFTLMAGLARWPTSGRTTRGSTPFLADVARTADDDRPVVRKGASWALRQIGKRGPALHARAVETALELAGRPGRGLGGSAGTRSASCAAPRVLARMNVLLTGDPRWIVSPVTGTMRPCAG